MGTGLEVALIATIVAGTGYQVERSQAAAREQKRAAKDQERANQISQAQQENERQAAIRQQVRQERIRRAQVMSAAEAAGVRGSSVEASTIGSSQTLTATGQAFASGATLSSNLQSSFLQKAADHTTAANYDLAQGQYGTAVAQLGMMGLNYKSIGGTDSGTS